MTDDTSPPLSTAPPLTEVPVPENPSPTPSPTDNRVGDPVAINENADNTTKALADVSKARQDNAQEKQQAIAPLQNKAIDLINQPDPEKEKVELPKAPAEAQFGKNDVIALGVGMAAVGLLFGHKAGWGATAGAMGSLMTAYNTGRQEEIKRNYTQYEAQYKQATERQKIIDKEFNSIIENKNKSIKNIMEEAKIYASKYEAKDVALAVQKGDISELYKINDKRAHALGQLDQNQKKLNPDTTLIEKLKPDARIRVENDFVDLDIGISYAKNGAPASAWFDSHKEVGATTTLLRNLVSSNSQLAANAYYNRLAVGIASLQVAGQKPTQAQVNEARKMVPTILDPPVVRAEKIKILEEFRDRIYHSVYSTPTGEFRPPVKKGERGGKSDSAKPAASAPVKGGSVLTFNPATGQIE